MIYKVLVTNSIPKTNLNGRIDGDHFVIQNINSDLRGEDLEYYISGWLNSKGYYSQNYNWVIINEQQISTNQSNSKPKETRETFLKCLGAVH